jgi:polyhydroxyalkanoate synthesis regulator phasin
MGLDEAIQAFASIEYDYYARSAGVEAIKAVYDATFNRAEKPDADEALWKASAKMMGSVMGGMLRVLTPAKRLVSTFYEEEAKLRNYRDSATSEFIGEISKSIPGIATLYQAPPLMDPVSLKPVTEQKPYMRFFGFNYIHQMFTRPKLTTAEALAQRMFPVNFTTPLTDQDKLEAARVRSEIKQALRSGKINEDRAETLVDYHVSRGTLTETQGGRLKADLKLSYLEEIVKYRVSLKDKDHVRKIKELMRKASPRERALIMEILANKKTGD